MGRGVDFEGPRLGYCLIGTVTKSKIGTRLPSFGASWVCLPVVFSYASGVYHLDGVFLFCFSLVLG